MSLLYITADEVGKPNHGGGSVTWNEWEALCSLGESKMMDRNCMNVRREEPWGWDESARYAANQYSIVGYECPKLAHFYAGTFTKTVAYLRNGGAKVSYTAAAHDIEASKREHSLLQIPFNYPHLTDPALWKRYVGGYLAADLVICPSTHSAECMRRYGCKNIKVIPHGVDLPKEIAPLPKVFTVGCLGAVHGPDKGLIYLLQAWKQLNYKDAQLIIAGPHSQSQFVQDLCHKYGGGRIWLRGWVDNVSNFYNDISLYVQPSVTEGFGIEVLEAMAHERPVLCSTGAGAVDVVEHWWRYQPLDIEQLASKIDTVRGSFVGRYQEAKNYTWDKIKQLYVETWKELLAC